MTHKLKTLGLALVAVFAVCAVAAPGAMAESLFFYGGSAPATLKGVHHTAEDVFTVAAGSVKCKKATYTGTLGKEEATSVELTPTYSECTAFGGLATTIEMNGCNFRLAAGEFGGGKASGTMDILCPAGKEIKAKVSVAGITKCTVDIPAQTNLSGISYTNVSGSAHQVTVTIGIEGKVKYTDTAGTGLGSCATASGENGSYTGNTLVTTEGATEKTGLAIAVPKPLFVLNPAKVNFEAGGAGKVKNTVIENKSQEEPKLDMTIMEGEFEDQEKCLGKTLKKEKVAGDKCTEEIECEAAGAKGTFLVLATASFAVNKATLENC